MQLTSSFRIELLVLALALMVGPIVACSTSTDDSNANLVGDVTVDGEIAQGVELRVEDSIGNEATTQTNQQGRYAFVVLPGEQTLSLTGNGIPNDATCTPPSPRQVTVPEDEVVEADFACETPGSGGMGGMGGMGGGTGGTGGSTCGSPVNSPDADLAGNVTVLVNGVVVTDDFPPAEVAEGDTIQVDVPVTAGTRFVNVTYSDNARSETIGAAGSATQGAETVILEFTALGSGQFPEGAFPLIVILENQNGTRNVFYETQLPDCDEVLMSVETNGVFGPEVPAPDCIPSCLFSPP